MSSTGTILHSTCLPSGALIFAFLPLISYFISWPTMKPSCIQAIVRFCGRFSQLPPCKRTSLDGERLTGNPEVITDTDSLRFLNEW